MSERFTGENSEYIPSEEERRTKEWQDLLDRAKQGVDKMSPEERERLVELGQYYLETEKNEYRAARAFEATNNFEGLRKVADHFLRESPNSFELPHLLNLLEDYEGIRDLLNRDDIEFHESIYYEAFRPLDQALFDYIHNFLDENNAPAATGAVNTGIDLIAIRNLAREFDVAVPIARGGLNQGAMANLWGMPTRIVDIAAHGRKTAKGKWINPPESEDFKDKRVLLFDKDAVTGASVRKAIDMLAGFETADTDIGIYFTHPVLPRGHRGIGTKLDGLPSGLEILDKNNAPLEQAGDAYIEAHEKLGTLYGRRRKIEQLFIKEADKLQAQFPELSESLIKFASEHFSVFDSLNPSLPGISEVRERMVNTANRLYQDHKELLRANLYSFPATLGNFMRLLADSRPLYDGFESSLLYARYTKRGEEAAKQRGVENIHLPGYPVTAFYTARLAVQKGFDMAIIVGPEGFAYEPYFQDLGVPTLAVNIPESGADEDRTINFFDDLSVLQGKKVLVVEDDIRTGATLKKLLEHIKSQTPERLGLYLGQPENFQLMSNIPAEFTDTFVAKAGDDPAAGQDFVQYLESVGLNLFKNKTDRE